MSSLLRNSTRETVFRPFPKLHTKKNPPQERFWTPPPMIRFPPHLLMPCHFLRQNGHRPDQSHFLSLGARTLLYVSSPPKSHDTFCLPICGCPNQGFILWSLVVNDVFPLSLKTEAMLNNDFDPQPVFCPLDNPPESVMFIGFLFPYGHVLGVAWLSLQ